MSIRRLTVAGIFAAMLAAVGIGGAAASHTSVEVESLCVNRATGEVRAAANCTRYEFGVNVDSEAPFDMNVSRLNAELGWGASTSRYAVTITVTGDGSTPVSIHRSTGQMFYGHINSRYMLHGSM